MLPLIGRLRRSRKLHEQVAAAEERAAAAERSRIARELHDVVAHSVSEMVVQASAVRYLLHQDQQRERAALRSVEQIGREALTEMRHMLGVMRSDEAQPVELTPQPGLGHLDQLVAQVEETGLPVSLRVEGTRPDLSIGIDLSAYRIVQEALANALEQAKAAHAEVVVRYADGGVELEVADDGRGSNGSGRADGNCIAGLRERVALYGGTLECCPRDGGGFVVRAQLPVEARS